VILLVGFNGLAIELLLALGLALNWVVLPLGR
jgi:hypothetical protein